MVRPLARAPRATLAATSLALVLLSSVALMGQARHRRPRGCPTGMVAIEGLYCIDRFEGSLVEVLPRGRTRNWSPYVSPERGHSYRAVSRAGVVPQGYISQIQAEDACGAAGKRLCTAPEWTRACHGPAPTTYPYGDDYVAGRCNDGRVNPVPRLYPGVHNVWHDPYMNDPRLNQMPGSLARTGQFRRCTNRYGVRDMVGNLHEWTAQRSGRLGVFRGGYYVDIHINGHGCNYATAAHYPGYHDYSTGFRCCADLH